MITMASDAILDAVQGAAEIIVEMTRQRFCPFHRRTMYGYVNLDIHTPNKRFTFCFGKDARKPTMLVSSQDPDGTWINRPLFWTGGWGVSGPRWTPEEVAALVLATIGTWDDPKNTRQLPLNIRSIDRFRD